MLIAPAYEREPLKRTKPNSRKKNLVLDSQITFSNAPPKLDNTARGNPNQNQPRTSDSSPKKGKKEAWMLWSEKPIATFPKKFKPASYWSQAYGKLGPAEQLPLRLSFPMDIPIPSRLGNTDKQKPLMLGKVVFEQIYEAWKTLVNFEAKAIPGNKVRSPIIGLMTRGHKLSIKKGTIYPDRLECSHYPSAKFIKCLLVLNPGYLGSSEKGKLDIEWEVWRGVKSIWRTEIMPLLITQIAGDPQLRQGMISDSSTLDEIIDHSYKLYKIPIFNLFITSGGFDMIPVRDNSPMKQWGTVDPAFFMIKNASLLVSNKNKRLLWRKLTYLYFLGPLGANREPSPSVEFAKSLKGLTRKTGVSPFPVMASVN